MYAAEAPGEVCRAVPRYDYRQQFGNLDGLLAELASMLLDGRYILTQEVGDFERSFAQYCGCAFSKGVNSGTDALVLTFRALGIGQGDRVIAPANTFHATVAAIELVRAVPVLVDAHPDTFLMDEDGLASAWQEHVRAVVPVHLFGKPARMPQIVEFAASKGLSVIEDAAQAHGASIDGRRVGSFGDAGCFSFHPSKNLAAAGDAGAIVTNNPKLAGQIEALRSLGQVAQNVHVLVGLNSKLDALQARILSWKLAHLDAWNASRAKIAAWYRSELQDLPVAFQARGPGEVHVYHLFQMRTEKRDALLRFLKERSIDAVIRYPTPIHLQPAFAKWGWREGDYPVAESLAKELLCLPIRPEMGEGETGFVVDAVRTFFDNYRCAKRI
ncbi:MAG: DegT/DnrJ/EryC1/StrS family aminotransferase [Acidobacteriota bacterium]|nr:DegT/DnrJ/EryC1/StrS family aminotransferase [Acidobacteriota bacterium]